MEMPLVPVLADMEYEGVSINSETLHELSDELLESIREIERDIYQLANAEFNIGSPKQLGEVLFDQMKLVERPKRTKSGQYATGEVILSDLATEHDIARRILDYRELVKLKNTYVDALPKLVSNYDGRIHTSYNQAVTSTGRLSSTNPNLPKYPNPHRKGAADSEGVCAAQRRVCADGRRLLAGGAAHHRLVCPGRNHDRGLSAGAGHPRHHRQQDVPSAHYGGNVRDAAQGQDGQLRHYLRGVIVWVGPAAKHSAGRSVGYY